MKLTVGRKGTEHTVTSKKKKNSLNIILLFHQKKIKKKGEKKGQKTPLKPKKKKVALTGIAYSRTEKCSKYSINQP